MANYLQNWVKFFALSVGLLGAQVARHSPPVLACLSSPYGALLTVAQFGTLMVFTQCLLLIDCNFQILRDFSAGLSNTSGFIWWTLGVKWNWWRCRQARGNFNRYFIILTGSRLFHSNYVNYNLLPDIKPSRGETGLSIYRVPSDLL